MRTVEDRARAATLHDVAERVGVSPRTVSRVVNDQGGFSEATRERVLAAVAELRYRPNLMARGLITRRSNTIAFIAPVLSDPFFPEVAEGVQRAAADANLTMICAINEHREDVEHQVLERFAAHAPEGIIVFPAGADSAHLTDHLDQGARMVVIDAPVEHPNAVNVMSDLAGGTKQAVEHLLRRGCRRLAMVANINSAEPRFRETAFRAALPDDMTPTVVQVDPTLLGGREATSQLLDAHPDLDGIFAYNDLVAIGALEAVRASGRTAPDDVAVVGCDGIDMGAVVSPTLTTIGIDRARLGREAVAALISMSRGESPPPVTVVPTALLVRDSA